MKKAKNRLKRDLRAEKLGGKKTDKSIEIFDIPIVGTQKREVLRKIGLQRKEMLQVATVNSEYVMEARRSERFRQILTKSLTVADGYGIVWAAQILRGVTIERVSGVELVREILRRANARHEKVFLLGARSHVAELAAAKMKVRYPGVLLAWYEGARSVRLEQAEEASLTIAKINSFEPDYLLVAYGSPWQEIWIEENRPYLRVRVALGVGGTLDEWAGIVKPCPNWMDQAGLKWLWRLVHEPWRWRRVLTVWQFGLLVLWHKLID